MPARRAYRDTLVRQGLEWSTPGAEHAPVLLPPGRRTVGILRAFEAACDGGILSTPRSRAAAAAPSGATSADGEP